MLFIINTGIVELYCVVDVADLARSCISTSVGVRGDNVLCRGGVRGYGRVTGPGSKGVRTQLSQLQGDYITLHSTLHTLLAVRYISLHTEWVARLHVYLQISHIACNL